MKRYVSLEDISDGHLYTSEDLVKAGCGDCKGCSDCCKSMADTIILDPLDAFRLTTGLSCTFEALLTDRLELGVAAFSGASGTECGGRDHPAPYEDVRCPGLLFLFKRRRPLYHP